MNLEQCEIVSVTMKQSVLPTLASTLHKRDLYVIHVNKIVMLPSDTQTVKCESRCHRSSVRKLV